MIPIIALTITFTVYFIKKEALRDFKIFLDHTQES